MVFQFMPNAPLGIVQRHLKRDRCSHASREATGSLQRLDFFAEILSLGFTHDQLAG